MEHSLEILHSWKANAGNWIKTVDGNEIESRRLVTNQAIVETICSYGPKTLLDVGCGEGWLTRTLRGKGIAAIGIDAIEALVANAIEKDGLFYSVCSYEDLVNGDGKILHDKDAVVFNFSLLDETDSGQLIRYLPKFLPKSALVFIQTLHPLSLANYGGCVTGWKEGSWTGLSQQYVLPYQWYFRTLKDWILVFAQAGLSIKEIKKPVHPETNKPASVIFVLNC